MVQLHGAKEDIAGHTKAMTWQPLVKGTAATSLIYSRQRRTAGTHGDVRPECGMVTSFEWSGSKPPSSNFWAHTQAAEDLQTLPAPKKPSRRPQLAHPQITPVLGPLSKLQVLSQGIHSSPAPPATLLQSLAMQAIQVPA